MAQHRGEYGVADLASERTGVYLYEAGASQSLFYAGSFMIDTGYDDPAGWTVGAPAAEVYGARVYATHGSLNPAPAAGAYAGEWRIAATPVWAVDHYVLPVGTSSRRRILILCETFLSAPYGKGFSQWYRVNTVDWTLYRI